jgi:hypothetical protein
MALHVIKGHLVSDALITQDRHEPIKQNCRIPIEDCRPDAVVLERFTSIVYNRGGTGEVANPEDQPSRMIDRRMIVSPRLAAQVWEFGSAICHCGQIIETSLR